jgi:mono/diheme cytochrome c family protein
MTKRWYPVLLTAFVAACAAESPHNPSSNMGVQPEYTELQSVKVVDAPAPVAGNFAPENRYLVEHGEYLVELLGCGGCHTDGALEGAPRMDKALAGSSIGIAYMNPFNNNRPGVVYPPNITPDPDTGIGGWSDNQIAAAVRAGVGRHTSRRIAVMPWQGYAKMSDEDANAIVAYLRSIKPVKNEVPKEVKPGQRATWPFVYFGTYRSR